MSASRYSPTDSGYWSSPRLKKPTNLNAVNLDHNQNVRDTLQSVHGIKSLSEPSSPQFWHKGNNDEKIRNNSHDVRLKNDINFK